jgi:hypothetical protein
MRILIFLILFVGVNRASAQETFPSTWVGDWEGTLELFNANGKFTETKMILEIHPLDTSITGRYFWGLGYNSKDDDWRPYEMVPVDTARGVWKVDEKNGIEMESYLIQGKLLSWFVVSGNRILFVYEKTGPDTIEVEVITGKETPVSNTKNEPSDEEPEVYEVATYPFSVYQRATLHRTR